MIIRQISTQNSTLLDACRLLAQNNYLENLVLLGDLYNPCIRLTRIFGLFDAAAELESFFVIFDGFSLPSIVFPAKMDYNHLARKKDFLVKILPDEFIVLSLALTAKDLISHFTIDHCVTDHCMVLNNSQKLLPNNPLLVTKATKKDFDRVDGFYRALQAGPWHPIQLESGFYHFIEADGKIVACGGTHFENPRLAQLGNIYVLSDYRRQGYGQLLTSTITREILKKKKMATLFVHQDNEPAKLLYEKLGFQLFKPAHLFFCQQQRRKTHIVK